MPKTYTVYYRKRGAWFWRKLKNVIGDGVHPSPCYTFFILADDTQIRLAGEYDIKFSPERAAAILHRMSAEAGQPLTRA